MDLVGDAYKRLQDLIARVETAFRRMGGEPLETPVFERTDVLLGKYGDEAESKLIYRLADQGGEDLTLRYDLTVPFQRFVKERGIKQMRRYSIGKVYRRDQPNPGAGRYREFYQADFDIFGEKQEGMAAEATLLVAVAGVLKELGVSFRILINDVRNLQQMLVERVGLQDWRRVCPVIDKLDKQSFDSLRAEFEAAGCSAEQIERLRCELLQTDPVCDATRKDWADLCDLAEILGFRDTLVYTSSLARGLDYYTGFVWEFKLENVAATVSAGGRYDGLLGAPAVGISVGISRLASVLPARSEIVWKDAYVVTSLGNVSLRDKMRVVKKLQESVPAECPITYSLTAADRKLNKVLADCATKYSRFVAIVGETELADGAFLLKDLKEGTQTRVSLE